MRSVRVILAVATCAVGVGAATISPASAAPSAGGSHAARAGCYTRLYFNQNTYVRTRPAGDATHLGLAYANDTFDYQYQVQNGFYYGRDARPTGKTGWVPIANISSMRVCPA